MGWESRIVYSRWPEKMLCNGFIGSANDIIFSTEPGVKDNSQVFSGGNFRDFQGAGWVMGRGV